MGAKVVILGVARGSLEGPSLSLFCFLEALGAHVGAELMILEVLGRQVADFGGPRGSLEAPPLRHFLSS